MADTRRFGLIDWLLLVLVVVLAAGARAGYLFYYADNGANAGPLLVQDPPALVRDLPPGFLAGKPPPNELEWMVRNLREENSYSSLTPFAYEEEQTAHYSPGYPWLLAWLGKLVGGNTDNLVRWIQCGLGALTAGLYFLFAYRAFTYRSVALLAGLFCAFYPFWVINTAAINDGVLTSFLLGLSLYLGARAAQAHGPFASLLYGLTLAGLALVRASMLPFAFVALGWFLLRSRHETRGWLCALLAFLGFANGLAPWTVRNFTVFGEPIPVVDSAYLHLWIGNNPKATGGPATEETWFHGLAGDRAGELRDIKDQPRRYSELGKDVWSEVRNDPVQTLQRRVRAALYFFLSERFFTDHRLADETEPGKAPAGVELPLELTLFGVLFFALLGWRWTYGWRKDAMPSSLALLWVPLPYILGHAEMLHGPRLPLDGVLLCYAAFALLCLIPGIGGKLLKAEKPKEEKEE